MVCYRFSPDDDFLENKENPFHVITHIYGETLKFYETKYFDEYPYEGVDYKIIGKIKDDVFNKIKLCFKNNPGVKRGYKKYL